MSEQGADKVGNKLANAAIIAALCFGIAALIAAFGLAYKNIAGW